MLVLATGWPARRENSVLTLERQEGWALWDRVKTSTLMIVRRIKNKVRDAQQKRLLFCTCYEM
jgi:hypothetical protein